jgi:hypothetical protein
LRPKTGSPAAFIIDGGIPGEYDFHSGKTIQGEQESQQQPHLSLGRRLLKSGVALGITALVSYYFGTSGVLVPGGLAFIPLVYVHGYWLPKQGINGWTVELRDKYYALRRIQPPDPPTGEPSGE